MCLYFDENVDYTIGVKSVYFVKILKIGDHHGKSGRMIRMHNQKCNTDLII